MQDCPTLSNLYCFCFLWKSKFSSLDLTQCYLYLLDLLFLNVFWSYLYLKYCVPDVKHHNQSIYVTALNPTELNNLDNCFWHGKCLLLETQGVTCLFCVNVDNHFLNIT